MNKYISILFSIRRMPKVIISLGGNKAIYNAFTRRHPNFPLLRRKTIGVALLPISGTTEDYLSKINGKNSAAYYSRKAERKGYLFCEINPNVYIDDIHTINTSKSERQGRKMLPHYLEKQEYYELKDGWKYFGVLNEKRMLVAYAWVPCCGQAWILNTLLGHGEYLNDGIMYLLVTRIALEMFSMKESHIQRYLMYDMFIGAQKGLKDFKLKCGFVPYRVRWVL